MPPIEIKHPNLVHFMTLNPVPNEEIILHISNLIHIANLIFVTSKIQSSFKASIVTTILKKTLKPLYAIIVQLV